MFQSQKCDFEEQRELNEQRTEEAINNREDTYFQLEKAIQEIVKLEERLADEYQRESYSFEKDVRGRSRA